MLKPPEKPRTDPEKRARRTWIFSFFWHIGKALLVTLQTFWLTPPVLREFEKLLLDFDDAGILTPAMRGAVGCLLLAVALGVPAGLWRFYDDIDDRSFRLFCADDSTAGRALRSPPCLIGAVTAVLTVLLPTAASFVFFFRLIALPLPMGGIRAVSIAAALIATGLLRFGLLWGRLKKWEVQKQRKGNVPFTKKRLVKLILGMICLYISIYVLIVKLFIPTLIPIFASLIRSFFHMNFAVLWILLLVAFTVAVGVIVSHIKRFRRRRRLLKRLRRLQDKGELTFTVEGSPYLSLYVSSRPFLLTVHDRVYSDRLTGDDRPIKTYQVAVATLKRRQMKVILINDHVYRVEHGYSMRILAGHRAHSNVTMTRVPFFTWYKNGSFIFPEGEGERILLLDPSPVELFLQDYETGSRLVPLDNSLKAFDYTVYGTQAFCNILERM